MTTPTLTDNKQDEEQLHAQPTDWHQLRDKILAIQHEYGISGGNFEKRADRIMALVNSYEQARNQQTQLNTLQAILDQTPEGKTISKLKVKATIKAISSIKALSNTNKEDK